MATVETTSKPSAITWVSESFAKPADELIATEGDNLALELSIYGQQDRRALELEAYHIEQQEAADLTKSKFNRWI